MWPDTGPSLLIVVFFYHCKSDEQTVFVNTDRGLHELTYLIFNNGNNETGLFLPIITFFYNMHVYL